MHDKYRLGFTQKLVVLPPLPIALYNVTFFIATEALTPH